MIVILSFDPPTQTSPQTASLTLLCDEHFYRVVLNDTNVTVYRLEAAHLGRSMLSPRQMIYQRPLLAKDLESEFAAILADPGMTIMEAVLSHSELQP